MYVNAVKFFLSWDYVFNSLSYGYKFDLIKLITYTSTKYKLFQETTNEQSSEKIGFVLMVRKGNKQQYKQFEAEIDSELAQNLRDQEQAQKVEKEKVKRLTLNITERFEEEDYQEMIQQQNRPVTQNLNRERKKYQHPKGAPDADLIFGSKRVR